MINQNPKNQTRLRENITVQPSSGKQVIVVHQESCPHCESLMSRLTGMGVPYDSLRVSTPIGAAYAKASMSKTVPVVVLKDYGDLSQSYLSLDTMSEDKLISEILEYLRSV